MFVVVAYRLHATHSTSMAASVRARPNSALVYESSRWSHCVASGLLTRMGFHSSTNRRMSRSLASATLEPIL
jgi:hypothetical protein